MGFTEGEVQALCAKYQMDMEEIKNWYDGYSFKGVASVYSPRSVVSSMRLGEIGNYWNQTETFEALKVYIEMNFEGLKDDVLSMIAGESIPVNTGSFTNDMTTFRNEDDVLTLLVHLGYLTYDYENRCVSIQMQKYVRNMLIRFRLLTGAKYQSTEKFSGHLKGNLANETKAGCTRDKRGSF